MLALNDCEPCAEPSQDGINVYKGFWSILWALEGVLGDNCRRRRSVAERILAPVFVILFVKTGIMVIFSFVFRSAPGFIYKSKA